MTCMNTVNSTCPFRTTSWKSLVAVMQRSASRRSSSLSICRQQIFRCLSESSHCPHLHHVLFDRFDLDLSIRTLPSALLSSVCKPNTDVVFSVWKQAFSKTVVICAILARNSFQTRWILFNVQFVTRLKLKVKATWIPVKTNFASSGYFNKYLGKM